MKITNIAYYLPSQIINNDELASVYSAWTAEKIFNKTGIRRRHVTAPDETALDLAEKASRKLFDGGVDKAVVDFLLFCTQSPDYRLPPSACILQNRLGLPKSCGATDFDLGCSGYIYGLALAKGLIAGGIAKNVLLVTAETYTKYIHPMDKSVRTIFGDGASATLIIDSAEEQIGKFVLGSDGSGAKNLIVPTGGMRKKPDAESAKETTDGSGNVRAQDNIFMNGPEIFNFTLDVVPSAVEKVLKKNGLSLGDIDLVIFHQANKFMLDVLRKTCAIPKVKYYVDLEDVGNTVSSSIPIALARAEAKGILKPGMKVLLVGFGVGLSWGATVAKW